MPGTRLSERRRDSGAYLPHLTDGASLAINAATTDRTPGGDVSNRNSSMPRPGWIRHRRGRDKHLRVRVDWRAEDVIARTEFHDPAEE